MRSFREGPMLDERKTNTLRTVTTTAAVTAAVTLSLFSAADNPAAETRKMARRVSRTAANMVCILKEQGEDGKTVLRTYAVAAKAGQRKVDVDEHTRTIRRILLEDLEFEPLVDSHSAPVKAMCW